MGDAEVRDKISDTYRTENKTILESGIENLVLEESKSEDEDIERRKAKNKTIDVSKAENEIIDGSGAEHACHEKKETIDEIGAEHACHEKKETIDEIGAEHACQEKRETTDESEDDVTKSVDGSKAEEKSVDENNAGEDTEDNAQKNVCTGHIYTEAEYEKALRKCNYFAENSYRCLKRKYDMSKQGFSDIQEDSINLPLVCSPCYTESIYRYDSAEALATYSGIALGENRRRELIEELKYKMINMGNNEADFEFLLHVAFEFLAAFDLKVQYGFEEAPECAIIALSYAMFNTDQIDWLDDWIVTDDELEQQ